MCADANRQCAYCGHGPGTSFFKTADMYGDEWLVCRCSACSAYFLSPRPTAAQLAHAYKSPYYGTGSEKFPFPISWIHRLDQRRLVTRILRGLPPEAKILDIGCGHGAFLHNVAREGRHELHGTELSSKALGELNARSDIKIHFGPLPDLSFDNQSFDAISMIHVFEHLQTPKSDLEIIYRILKPGGRLLISMPNMGSWQGRLFRQSWFHLDPPRHIFFFESGDLKNRLSEHGFVFEAESYFSPLQNSFGWVQSILNRLTARRELLFESLKGNMEYAPGYRHPVILLQIGFAAVATPVFIAFDMLESLLRQSGTMTITFRKPTQPV